MINHLLSTIPYEEVPAPDVDLPNRLSHSSDYLRPPRELSKYVPDYAASLIHEQLPAS